MKEIGRKYRRDELGRGDLFSHDGKTSKFIVTSNSGLTINNSFSDNSSNGQYTCRLVTEEKYAHTVYDDDCIYLGSVRLNDNDEVEYREGDSVLLCSHKEACDVINLSKTSDKLWGQVIIITVLDDVGDFQVDDNWYSTNWVERLATLKERVGMVVRAGAKAISDEVDAKILESYNKADCDMLKEAFVQDALKVGDKVLICKQKDAIDTPTLYGRQSMAEFNQLVTVVHINEEGDFLSEENCFLYSQEWIEEVNPVDTRCLEVGDKVLLCNYEDAQGSNAVRGYPDRKTYNQKVTVKYLRGSTSFSAQEDDCWYLREWIEEVNPKGVNIITCTEQDHLTKEVLESLPKINVKKLTNSLRRISSRESDKSELDDTISKLPKKQYPSPYNVLDVFDRPYKTPKRLVGFETMLPFKCNYCHKCSKMLGFKLDDGENELCETCMKRHHVL